MESRLADLDVARFSCRLDRSANGGARSRLPEAQPEELASAVTALTEREASPATLKQRPVNSM